MALVRNRRWDYLAANDAGPRGVRGGFRRPDRPAEPRPLRVPRRPRPGLLRRLAGRRARHARASCAPKRDETRTTRDPRSSSRSCRRPAPSSSAIWSQHDVRLPAAGLHRFHHPLVGDLDLVFEAAALRADPGLTLLLATARTGLADRSGTATARSEDRARRVTTGSNTGSKLRATEPNSGQLEPALDGWFRFHTTRTFRLGAGRSQVQILSPRSTPCKDRLTRLRCIAGTLRGANRTGWRERGRLRGGTVSADLRPPGHLHPVDQLHPAGRRVTGRAFRFRFRALRCERVRRRDAARSSPQAGVSMYLREATPARKAILQRRGGLAGGPGFTRRPGPVRP